MELGYRTSRSAKSESVRVVTVPDLTSETEKWCPKCQQYKSISMFYGDACHPDKVRAWCKTCDVRLRVERRRRTGK